MTIPSNSKVNLFRQVEPLPKLEQTQLFFLRKKLASLKHVCIAYSGGVDSALVAAISSEQLGDSAFAVTGVSAALSPHLLNEARQQAAWIRVKHVECQTSELEDPEYSKNPENRCFACKRELHKHLSAIAKAAKGAQVIDGVNHDDLGDYRPGITAAKEAGVRSPLAELKIGKTSIRQISKALGFPWWDKPAQPCLASRFPYGESITAKRLRQISKAEDCLRELGFPEMRVRMNGFNASIELPPSQIEKLILEMNKEKIVSYFLELGFTSVSLDLEGLISGKLNRKSNLIQP